MRGYHSISLPVLALILVLVLARMAFIASLAAGTVPCVGTQCENSVDNSDDVVVAEQRLPRAKDVPVPPAVPVRRSTRSMART